MDLDAGRSEQEKAMEMVMDSCAARSVMAYLGGYVMGAGFSVFGMMLGGSQTDNVGVREFWRRAGRSSLKMGKGFAVFGFFFSGFETVLEKRRGRHDWKNAGIAGGTIGAVQGYRFGGPPTALLGMPFSPIHITGVHENLISTPFWLTPYHLWAVMYVFSIKNNLQNTGASAGAGFCALIDWFMDM